MIKNNFFIPLMTIMLISTALMATSPNAFAHNDPDVPCNGVGAGTLIQVQQDGSTVTSAIQGSTVQTTQTLLELAIFQDTIPCAFDGGSITSPFFNGTIVIENPDGSTDTVNNGDIPCIGGTNSTGDLLLPADCFPNLTDFTSNARDYVVDCNDEVDAVLNFKATFTGRSHHEVDDSDDILKEDEITIDCVIPEYSFVTDADEQTAPYVNPTDQVNITGVGGVTGTWTTNATLNGPDASLPLAAVCVTTPDTTDTFDLVVECTVTGSFTDPGDYCWDVTVEETSGVYGIDGDGTQTGTFENNECFNIPPQVYTFVTDADEQTAPYVNPTDQVIITGVAGVEGTWTTNATLNGPDASLPLAAVCVTTPDTTDTFDLTVECTVTGVFSDPGQYCWDVTVEETTDAYTTSGDGTQIGTPGNNECFDITDIGEGCTPGYYRNNLALNILPGNDQSETQWYIDHMETFGTTFGVASIETQDNYNESIHKGKGKSDTSPNAILGESIWAQGGGINALARHATAALLNSANPDVAYSLSTGAILSLVQDALAGSPDDINNAKSILAGFNEDGCSVDQQPRIED